MSRTAQAAPPGSAAFAAASTPDPIERTVAENGFVEVVFIDDGRSLSPSATDPAHGTVLAMFQFLRGIGPILYVPDTGYVGEDSFLLDFNDSRQPDQEPTPVSVTVTPDSRAGDLPVARDDAGFAVPVGGYLEISFEELLANDTDVVTVIGIGLEGPGEAGFALFYEDVDFIGFQAADGFQGRASFVYGVRNADGQVDLATVSIQVGEPAPGGAYVRGTSGGDLLDRSSATERVLIAGLDGNDTLRGGAGNDVLNGGTGNDVISGGAGNDLIAGGAGADRMAGGRGADTFLIARGDLSLGNATDLIVDFQGAGAAGGDAIRFTGFGSGAVLERIGTVGNAGLYEVQDAAGANLGRLLVGGGGSSAGLAAGDYAFA